MARPMTSQPLYTSLEKDVGDALDGFRNRSGLLGPTTRQAHCTKKEETMTIPEIALNFLTTDLGHLGAFVIALFRPPTANATMTKTHR